MNPVGKNVSPHMDGTLNPAIRFIRSSNHVLVSSLAIIGEGAVFSFRKTLSPPICRSPNHFIEIREPVWSFLGSTTATLCSMALHPAPSTSCSGYRTTPQESFIKRQDDHTHTHCWRNCIGCRWSSASATSWPYWRSRYGIRQHRHISVGTSEHAVALVHCGAVISCSISRRAVQTHWHRQTIFQLCCACNLELSASCCHQLWRTLFI